jgi:hypothetical protein
MRKITDFPFALLLQRRGVTRDSFLGNIRFKCELRASGTSLERPIPHRDPQSDYPMKLGSIMRLDYLLLLIGTGFVAVVVLTHVAEALHIFPWMGWGLRNSPGHYLDLVSAIAGPILLTVGYLSRRFARRRI